MKKKVGGVFWFLFIFMFIVLVGCDNALTSNSNLPNDICNDTKTEDDGLNTNGKPNDDEDIFENSKSQIIGRWVNGNIYLEFRHERILFQDRPLWDPQRRIHTHGNFRWLSYDGTTVKFETLLNPPTVIEFTAILYDDRLVVSGLGAFHFAPNIPGWSNRILCLHSWNRGYTRYNQ